MTVPFMSLTHDYSHLTHIASPEAFAIYDLNPHVVWVFDLDKHGWWWGNRAAISFWGLKTLQELLDKDLSGDTQGARDRTRQTFERAAEEGLTVDPWTTYPQGKPKTLLMMHRAVLLGPEKHRGIIAFVNEQVNLGEEPENLLLMEAMRYTRIPATTFTLEGSVVVENPAATEIYPHKLSSQGKQCAFISRFANHEEGVSCLEKIQSGTEGRWDYIMQTRVGERRHSLDIRRTRHPLTGDFLFLVLEYDFTERYNALKAAEDARAKLHDMAMKDALTGVHSLNFMQEAVQNEIDNAALNKYGLWLMFVDLDGFKRVNDSLGHAAGDRVLQMAAQRIQSTIRSGDHLARIGGDEYVLLLSHEHSEKDVRSVAQRIVTEIQQVFLLDNHHVRISASIGVAKYPEDGNNLDELLKAADTAMYYVKQHGRNSFSFAQVQ